MNELTFADMYLPLEAVERAKHYRVVGHLACFSDVTQRRVKTRVAVQHARDPQQVRRPVVRRVRLAGREK